LVRIHRNSLLVLGSFELHFAIDQREDGEVVAKADVFAFVKLGAALANDDAAGLDDLAAVDFHATILRLGVSTVSG